MHDTILAIEPLAGHREGKKQRTRKALIAAARRLYLERGFEVVFGAGFAAPVWGLACPNPLGARSMKPRQAASVTELMRRNVLAVMQVASLGRF